MPETTDSTFLELQQRCERLESRRRFGVAMMYSPIWGFGALLIAASISLGGGGLMSNLRASGRLGLTDIPLMIVGFFMMCGPFFFIGGMLIRAKAAAHIVRAMSPHATMAAIPALLVGERIGQHRVVTSSCEELLLETRFGLQREALRNGIVVCAVALIIATIYFVQLGGMAAPGMVIGALLMLVPAIWAISPHAVRWRTVSGAGGKELAFDMRKLMWRCRIRTIKPNDIAGFEVIRENGHTRPHPSLVLMLANGGRIPLAQVGYGRLADWQSRRLVASLERILQPEQPWTWVNQTERSKDV